MTKRSRRYIAMLRSDGSVLIRTEAVMSLEFMLLCHDGSSGPRIIGFSKGKLRRYTFFVGTEIQEWCAKQTGAHWKRMAGMIADVLSQAAKLDPPAEGHIAELAPSKLPP